MENDERIQTMGPRFFECLWCNDMLYCKPDGTLRYCKGGCLGIDHTDLYTRFLGNGVMVKVYDEDKNFIGKHIPNVKPAALKKVKDI